MLDAGACSAMSMATERVICAAALHEVKAL
jgi:hypothetical protein